MFISMQNGLKYSSVPQHECIGPLGPVGASPDETTKLEHLSCEARLRELELFSMEKTLARP